MAHQRTNMAPALVLAVAALWAAAATAQSTDCTNVLISLSPCLNYIMGNSSGGPSSACCAQLGSVVRSQPQCLCQVLNGGASSAGININQTQAVALPKACNVQTPPVSLCNAGRTDSPAGSPAGSPDSPTTEPTGRGPNTIPNNGSSDATNPNKMAAPLLLFLLLVVPFASGFATS